MAEHEKQKRKHEEWKEAQMKTVSVVLDMFTRMEAKIDALQAHQLLKDFKKHAKKRKR